MEKVSCDFRSFDMTDLSRQTHRALLTGLETIWRATGWPLASCRWLFLQRWVARIAPGMCEGIRLHAEPPRGNETLAPALRVQVDEALSSLPTTDAEACDQLGLVFESLMDLAIVGNGLRRTRGRRGTGSFFTPRRITDVVVASAFDAQRGTPARILDPAMGGGAFLLAAARRLRSQGEPWRGALARLFGVDSDPLAVAVTEAALMLAAGVEFDAETTRENLLVGNAVTGACGEVPAFGPEGLNWNSAFCGEGFSLVVGNPPWVAFAGRAAQPLAPELRRHFRAFFPGWGKYPTLQALFLERSVQLAKSGVVALILPSPIADLEGYAATRRAATTHHELVLPLKEFGEDAFRSVVQPCFALVLRPSQRAARSTASWPLTERTRSAGAAASVEPPAPLRRLANAPPLPAEAFREMGFQSAGPVSKQLFFRGADPPPEFDYPLLEGRNVKEFQQGKPVLFLRRDARILREHRCRLRPLEDYRLVDFVVRQTAQYPIAASHSGAPFRNSLLAGFSTPGFSTHLLVGLLNSALCRALHVGFQRDARQRAFPQVKIRHLRALPAPPIDDSEIPQAIERCVQRLPTERSARRELDELVFQLYGIGEERSEILGFLRDYAPAACVHYV